MDRKGVRKSWPGVAYLTYLHDNRILPLRERILTHVRIELVVPSNAKGVCRSSVGQFVQPVQNKD